MSYLEIKAIKAVAALHRGVVSTAIKTLDWRGKLAMRKYESKLDYAEGLQELAFRTQSKARKTQNEAVENLNQTMRNINAATHTVLNLRDDLNKID